MNNKNPIFKRSSFWALALGVAIGGASVASLHSPLGIPNAYAADNAHTAAAISPESMGMLRSLDSSLSSLAEAVEPAVVHIEVASSGKPGQMSSAMKAEGSGVIFREDGYIITNDHVVNGFDDVKVTLTDGRAFPGKVLRSDNSGDIAVIKIDAKNLPTLPFSDSNKLKAGQLSMAVGSPFGLQNSVTIGHISALDRGTTIGDERQSGGVRFYPDLVQTDAAINPGNSGGALVNVNGEIMGINTAIESPTGGSNGIGFAIPSNQARLIAQMLIEKGKIDQAFLGVSPIAIKEFQKPQLGVTSGAYLDMEPLADSPAGKAGLQKGDVVIRIGSSPITTYMDLRNAMYKYTPGQQVEVEYVRDKQHKTVSITLGKPPVRPAVQQQPQQRMQSPFGGGQNPFGGGQDPFGGEDSPFRRFRFQFPQGQGQNPGQGQGDGNGYQVVPRVHTGAVHLGASVAPITDDLRAQFNLPSSVSGAVIVEVESGSVADGLGLKSGDVIKTFNGKAINAPEELIAQLKTMKWNDKSSISYERYGDGNSVSKNSAEFQFK